MRRPQYTITARAVHQQAARLCQQHLKLRDHGPKCTAPTLLLILFYAAARLTSLASACASLRKAPSDQAVRDALRATLPPVYDLQRALNRALVAPLPKALRRRRQPLALDLTLLPYHGEPCYLPLEIYRSKPKSGTSHFHAYATLYVVRKGQRFTLALDYVLQGDALEDIIRYLLRQAARVGVRPRYLLLDRGFYSVSVIRYLQAARYPFLMPAVCRGRPADHPRGPSGTRAFQSWTRSGWSQYTLKDKNGRKATVSICVKGRNRRQPVGGRGPGRRKWVYAYWGIRPRSWDWVAQTYRLRFAIETTYRQMHQARIRTSTRDPQLRLLFVGLALILRNVWVWLHWEVFSHPRRGGRRVDLNQMVFRRMLLWLQHLAEASLEVWDETYAERPMPP